MWGGSIFYTDPPFLHLPRCHDDDPCVLLPDHLPKITDGCGQAALSGDVNLLVGGLPQVVLQRSEVTEAVGVTGQDTEKSSRLRLRRRTRTLT